MDLVQISTTPEFIIALACFSLFRLILFQVWGLLSSLFYIPSVRVRTWHRVSTNVHGNGFGKLSLFSSRRPQFLPGFVANGLIPDLAEISSLLQYPWACFPTISNCFFSGPDHPLPPVFCHSHQIRLFTCTSGCLSEFWFQWSRAYFLRLSSISFAFYWKDIFHFYVV